MEEKIKKRYSKWLKSWIRERQVDGALPFFFCFSSRALIGLAEQPIRDLANRLSWLIDVKAVFLQLSSWSLVLCSTWYEMLQRYFFFCFLLFKLEAVLINSPFFCSEAMTSSSSGQIRCFLTREVLLLRVFSWDLLTTRTKSSHLKILFIQTILKSVNLITNWRRRQKIRWINYLVPRW